MPLLFLSPSLQPFNQYPSGGNEQYYMNLITDEMVPILISCGIQFTRNILGTNLRTSINSSNNNNYDLHLAIHSNSSPSQLSGILKGTDVYYRPESFRAREAAMIIADNLKEIYPNPELVKAVPTTTLAELNLTNAPAVLVELAYHDNAQDEQWIKNNIANIAANLVESLTIFFDIPFIYPPMIPATGVVTTSGSNLNLRKKPSTDSDIILKIPNSSYITILGQYYDWYVVNYPAIGDWNLNNSFYSGITGYAASQYISI